jgi:hypothetical protein
MSKKITMLKTISWFQFGFFILGVLALYYAVIVFVYYRKEVSRKLFKPKGNGNSFSELLLADGGSAEELGAGLESVSPEKPTAPASRTQEPDLYPVANELVETLDEFIVQAGKKQQVKEEVVFGIHQIIERYPMLQATGFKVAINNYINIALKNNFAFSLDEIELASLWAK